ncbi:MFS transporter [Rhizobium leguminosarum]|uniref:YbfB/YjiJ family MFS transporter n=1 Tax=Rhizobium leguminosarum TaxID=384 RepID=UPI00102FAB28|nr:YbfB/YjiJ family MFS transporter [Rhizobium leguminosarum]TAV49911.1 MFS transporter [Rhizobium leguminosarum]TAV59274.1 MFS transporter [Rhizobium leguminosarum]TAV70321.1 MFS transporter [Rhizobium leguminosarum]TAY67938.1 MFS transporter [Rhizobium leguminosarum]
MLARTRNSPPNLVSIAAAGAVAMAAAMGFGRFSYTPILPGMISGVPLSAADAGFIASTNFVGYLVGAVLAAYGWAAGRERLVALLSLLATAILLAAMAATDSVAVFAIIRFLAGVASAFAMVFTSSIVLSHGAAAGNDHVQAAHFGGPGAGIALSSVMVFLIGLGFHGPGGWRADWIGGALYCAVSLVVVFLLLPSAPAQSAQAGKEPALVWNRPMVLLTLSYGLFGFGYVITATFLVTIARLSATGPFVEFLCWFIAGLTATVALFAWKPLVRPLGLGGVYVAALLVEAAGVLATVALPPSVAPLIGGALFGATFLAITAYGLQIGRKLSPDSPRRILAMMTAAFGVGQIVGPVVAGWIAERTGSFTVPTMIAAAALIVCAALVMPVIKKIA